MPIFSAIGLGVTIIVLKVLTPEIFSGIEKLAIAFLTLAHSVLLAAATIGATVGASVP